LAAEWAGIKNVWANENDPFCCKVLAKNFPKMTVYEEDIRTLKGIYTDTDISNNVGRGQNQTNIRRKLEQYEYQGVGKSESTQESYTLPYVDIISGGFPCQPFSHAGKRGGVDDDRYLWPEMLRVIREVRPRWVIGENVAGLESMENGTPFEEWIFLGMESTNIIRRIYSRHIYRKRQTFVVIQILESLKREGYQVEVYSIPACGVGAWHRRQRIWIVGHQVHSPHPNPNGTGPHREKIDFKREAEFRDKQEREFGQMGEDVSDPGRQGLSPFRKQGGVRKEESGTPASIERGSMLGREWDSNIWDIEPSVGRVANGIPNRVDRLKGLGNAIVPQVVFEIFKAILDYDK